MSANEPLLFLCGKRKPANTGTMSKCDLKLCQWRAPELSRRKCPSGGFTFRLYNHRFQSPVSPERLFSVSSFFCFLSFPVWLVLVLLLVPLLEPSALHWPLTTRLSQNANRELSGNSSKRLNSSLTRLLTFPLTSSGRRRHQPTFVACCLGASLQSLSCWPQTSKPGDIAKRQAKMMLPLLKTSRWTLKPFSCLQSAQLLLFLVFMFAKTISALEKTPIGK